MTTAVDSHANNQKLPSQESIVDLKQQTQLGRWFARFALYSLYLGI